MSEVILDAQGLGKKYVLQHRVAGYDTLREKLGDGLRRLVRGGSAAPHPHESPTEEFWALREASLQIRQGEAVGLIGRNGAGKSTLLKIISRITEPTEGRLRIRGRVASLLEVGTGFHPELTGRENVFLNGAILGMARTEIRAKFDQIVAFAEVAQFLDTPVKRYSSGMYVRLAFSVAAHLEPDVLIVDEVLAVGDASFQKKCLERMAEVSRMGRTIVFVSHNLGLVRSMCGRGILLDNGRVACDGPVESTVARYLESFEPAVSSNLLERRQRRGTGMVRLSAMEIRDSNHALTSKIEAGQAVQFVFRATGRLPALSCSFTIYDSFGQAITCFDSALQAAPDPGVPEATPGTGRPSFVCELRELFLTPGRYRINAALYCRDELLDHVESVAMLDVDPGISGTRPVLATPGYGSVYMPHRWTGP
jgi:homopolymeric O-antigen transport system ATP-binding protein